jgi:serine protease DegQ
MKGFWLSACLAVCCLVPPLARADAPKKDDAKKAEGTAYQIPYKLTEVKHVLIRAKINGKGPFNFILDTGAPSLFVSTKTCKKLGIEPDDKGWGTFDRFDIEGGLSIPKAKGRIDDPFQLEGMNSLGLAGAELHGVIGYSMLARFKLEFDFTKDKMTWTELDFKPKAPEGLGGKANSADMDAMASLVKLATAFLGKSKQPEPVGRGFLGLELMDDKDAIVVKSVLADAPAAKGGLKAGDVVVNVKEKGIKNSDDLRKATADMKAGDSIKLSIKRAGETKDITITAGEGL